MKEEEKNKWLQHMEGGPVTSPARWAPDPLGMLALHVRELLSGWKRVDEEGRSEDIYCPDQQGCFETPAGEGGTLATAESEESTDYSLLRLGVAKTKGKARVVTMQPARVKRLLTPVHNSLYNHLSKSGALVRGDFTKEDAESVILDRRPGELFTSGDYSSATNELHQDAVKTVVAEICNSPAVTPDEKKVLWQSFQRLRVKTCHGVKQVNRGSMMGNLVSFPILCLINMACYHIVCDIMHGPFNHRVGKFNGDDCLFNADQQFYQLWTEVTSTFGLVVNHEKTGRSERWLDLNSTTYDSLTHRFVAKPVLSFLLRERDAPECVVNQVLEGLRSFKNSVKEYVLNVLMRREISLRGVDINTIPVKWLRTLIKRAWFRNALVRGRAPIRERGTKRQIEMVVDRPPRSRFYGIFDEMARDLRSDYIERWKGVKVKPFRSDFSRTGIRRWLDQVKEPSMPAYRLSIGPRVWRWTWPRELRDFLKKRGLFDLVTVSDTSVLWLDDHPNLVSQFCHDWKPSSQTWRQPPSLEYLRQWPLGYR
jgi:hypothetical protein